MHQIGADTKRGMMNYGKIKPGSQSWHERSASQNDHWDHRQCAESTNDCYVKCQFFWGKTFVGMLSHTVWEILRLVTWEATVAAALPTHNRDRDLNRVMRLATASLLHGTVVKKTKSPLGLTRKNMMIKRLMAGSITKIGVRQRNIGFNTQWATQEKSKMWTLWNCYSVLILN